MKSWKMSKMAAGGGVLALEGYGMLEGWLALRGLPETVTACVANCRRRPDEPPRETEDIAAAIFRYEGGGLALVRASWDLPPFGQLARHHADERTLEIRNDSIRLSGGDASSVE